MFTAPLGQENQLTPLHCAVIEGDYDETKRLLDNGAQVNAQDGRKWTPLHFAIARKFGRIAGLLVALGADRWMKNDNGASAWDFESFCSGNKKIQHLNIHLRGGCGQLLSAKEFEILTGARYITDAVVSAHLPFSLI